jgi:cell division septal protein FtsQ
MIILNKCGNIIDTSEIARIRPLPMNSGQMVRALEIMFSNGAIEKYEDVWYATKDRAKVSIYDLVLPDGMSINWRELMMH